MKNKMIKILAISLLVIVLLSLFVFNVFAVTSDCYIYQNRPTNLNNYDLSIQFELINCYFSYNDVVYNEDNNYTVNIVLDDNSFTIYLGNYTNYSNTYVTYTYNRRDTFNFILDDNYIVYCKCQNGQNKYLSNKGTNISISSSRTNINSYITNGTYLYLYMTISSRSFIADCYFESLPSAQPLSKIYDVGSFINDYQEYDQIVVNGLSSDSSIFESITDIDYRNTLTESSDTVYSNSTWNGNYNSILNYYANGNVPVVSNINNDLNNLLTFSTNVLPVTFNNTYDVGVFINNGNEYDHINVVGTTINNSTYSSIVSIDYVNNVVNSRDTVYSNGSWNDDFTSVLTYYSSGTVPDVSTINSATSSIITFTTSLYSVNISRTYYFDFYNNDQYFTSVTVNGVSNDNVVLSSVTSVYYDNTLVYDGLFITPYTRMLYYYNNMTVPDVHDLNEFCNFIVYFTPTVITTVSPDIVDELLAGVNVLLLPITSFISLAENNFVIAIILVMGLFGMVAVTVFSFIKRKNE